MFRVAVPTSGKRIDFVDVAFDNEGDDGDGTVVEGQSLTCQHNAGMRGDDLVHLRGGRFF